MDKQILCNLEVFNPNNSTSLCDGFRLKYGDYPIRTGSEKMINPGENISIYRDSKDYIVDRRQLVTDTDTVQLRVCNLLSKNYRLVIHSQEYTGTNLTCYLHDTYINTKTEIPLTGIVVNYDFSVVAGDNEFRFKIVIEKTKAEIGIWKWVENKKTAHKTDGYWLCLCKDDKGKEISMLLTNDAYKKGIATAQQNPDIK